MTTIASVLGSSFVGIDKQNQALAIISTISWK
jgi:hypothetical protein